VDISGNRMRIAYEAILEGNEDLGRGATEFRGEGADRNEGPPRPRIGDTLSIHLSQQANSAAIWEITVYVQVAQGWFILGLPIVTNPPKPSPPAVGDPAARTIGFASCPGAIGWKVQCICETDGEEAQIWIQSRQGGGGGAPTFGVTPNSFVPPG
jgi:hypothetical protein